jgi:hypothetical protein
MNPNACVDQIVSALLNNDLVKAAKAINDLDHWFGAGGFVPTNVKKLVDLRVADKEITAKMQKLRLSMAYLGQTRAHTQPIANPEFAWSDAVLKFVLCNHRRNLGVYVWSASDIEALEDAEDFASGARWLFLCDELKVFPVTGIDRDIVLFRSKMLT